MSYECCQLILVFFCEMVLGNEPSRPFTFRLLALCLVQPILLWSANLLNKHNCFDQVCELLSRKFVAFEVSQQFASAINDNCVQ